MESADRGFVANVASCRVSYSVSSDLPARLFLKVTKPELHVEYRLAGQREVQFYRHIASDQTDLPIPRCYLAEWDPQENHASLLLEDLSTSHTQRPLPLPPGPAHSLKIVESLAKIHARWWNHPALGKSIGEALTSNQAAESLSRLHTSLPHFLDYLGDALLPARREAYERILSSTFLHRRADRLQNLERVTLIHGDAHTNNVMLPINEDDAVLIDWHRWSIDIPLIDVAFLIALHWSSPRRRHDERLLIEHYHQTLLANGVDGYSFDDCWRDYRESVIIMTLIPIGQTRRGMPAGVIWYGTDNSMSAFDDLGCSDLL